MTTVRSTVTTTTPTTTRWSSGSPSCGRSRWRRPRPEPAQPRSPLERHRGMRRRRAIRSRLVLTVIVALAGLAMPPAAMACSCAAPGPLSDVQGDPNIAVFTATVDFQDARGFPMTVTRWFQGAGVIEPRVWFTAGSFSGDGASCGVAPLPVGTEWIFVAYRTEGMYGTGSCSQHAALATPEGQAMLA